MTGIAKRSANCASAPNAAASRPAFAVMISGRFADASRRAAAAIAPASGAAGAAALSLEGEPCGSEAGAAITSRGKDR
jgi:hypothetical protein